VCATTPRLDASLMNSGSRACRRTMTGHAASRTILSISSSACCELSPRPTSATSGRSRAVTAPTSSTSISRAMTSCPRAITADATKASRSLRSLAIRTRRFSVSRELTASTDYSCRRCRRQISAVLLTRVYDRCPRRLKPRRAVMSPAPALGRAWRVRLIDASIWPENSTGAVSELKRFESVCNVVLAALPVWMICPYNASLFNHILPDAYRTHPLVRDARVSREASTAYLEPGEFFKALDAEHKLPPAPRDARVLRFKTPGEARSLIVAEASAAGLHPDRIRDLEMATSEVATNAIRHARQGAEMRVWTAPDEIVCQVSDTGDGMKDPTAGYGKPEKPEVGGWGLLLARKLCDSVEVRTTSHGTVIRL